MSGISSVFVKTPLLEHIFSSPSIKKVPKFLLKYEFLQPSGSFKSRGIGHLISTRVSQIKDEGLKAPHVFASSGGNAGLAAATACRQLSVPCSVVVPTNTKTRIIDKIENTGAEVIVHGAHWKECDNFLKEKIFPSVDTSIIEPVYAHPFDNPLIWEGHSSMIHEIIASLKDSQISIERVKGIVCSVGGGGLYNGIITGLEKHGLANKIPVIGVETRGCHVFNESLKVGKTVEFKKITSIATSLGTANICDKTLEYAIKYSTKSIVLQDSQVVDTCLRFANDTNIVPEPACGAALHLGYHPTLLSELLKENITSKDVIIIIACGGSSTSLSDLYDFQADLADVAYKDDVPTNLHIATSF